MHDILLVIHNLVRWIVIVAGLIAVARAIRGVVVGAAWSPSDRRSAAIFTSTLHLQLLLGLVLYAISPITRGAMAHMASAMQDPATRKIAVEHPAMMILAVVLATAAGPMARKAANDRDRFRRQAVLLGVALLLVLAGIPWARPLVRGL